MAPLWPGASVRPPIKPQIYLDSDFDDEWPLGGAPALSLEALFELGALSELAELSESAALSFDELSFDELSCAGVPLSEDWP